MTQDTLSLLVLGGILAGFLALVVLLIAQGVRLRTWKRARRLVSADYRRLAADHQPTPLTLSGDDRQFLYELAEELRGCVETAAGDLLLDGAEHVYVCTRPVPAFEIEYGDRLVTLHFTVEHYAAEEVLA